MVVKSESLKALVDGIWQLNEEWDELRGKKTTRRPQPPANKAQIAKLQESLSISLPADYLEMLSLHNGWNKFEGDYSLLSIEQMIEDGPMKRRVQRLMQMQEENQKTAGQHGIIVLAGPYGWYCVYFDRSTHKPDGSMKAVQWEPAGEIRRHPSFTAFLQAHKNALQQVVEKERKKLRR
jgi:hypothetical protein